MSQDSGTTSNPGAFTYCIVESIYSSLKFVDEIYFSLSDAFLVAFVSTFCVRVIVVVGDNFRRTFLYRKLRPDAKNDLIFQHLTNLEISNGFSGWTTSEPLGHHFAVNRCLVKTVWKEVHMGCTIRGGGLRDSYKILPRYFLSKFWSFNYCVLNAGLKTHNLTIAALMCS